MILHQNPRLNHCGAPRRMNCDTPPLKGCCLALTSASWRCAPNFIQQSNFHRASANKRRATQKGGSDGETL